MRLRPDHPGRPFSGLLRALAVAVATCSGPRDARRGDDPEAARRRLARRLRRVPYWTEGHLRYARASLACGDLAAANASASAVRAASPDHDGAAFLLGVCRLRAGRAEEAAAFLGPLNRRAPGDPVVAGEYAAALVALGDGEGVKRVALGVPPSARGEDLRAALAYVGGRPDAT